MQTPHLSEKHKSTLFHILKDNPKQEVVGYFEVDESADATEAVIVDVKEVARGDDETVAYREFNPYVFHTHPLSALRMAEPPSGEDLMQALSWGYPDFNEKKRSCTWECVVASEGLWWYSGTGELRDYYFELQDRDEEMQNYLAKQIVRYANVLGTMLKNRRLTLAEFIKRLEVIDFYWMQKLIQDNESFLRDLEKQFPLAAMAKLTEAKYAEMRNVAGFRIYLEVNLEVE